jgi:hypothetical protein
MPAFARSKRSFAPIPLILAGEHGVYPGDAQVTWCDIIGIWKNRIPRKKANFFFLFFLFFSPILHQSS